MKYFAIRYFLADLETLTKKPKYNYGSVRADICEEFESTETSEEIIMKSDAVLRIIEDEDTYIVLKIRTKNTAMKTGKSGGFRLISVVIRQGNMTTFLSVYPKKGKFGINNIPNVLLEDLVEKYIEALETNTLIEVDIENELAIINDDK